MKCGFFFLAGDESAPLPAAGCLDVAGADAAGRSPWTLMRIYEDKTRPEPAVYAQKIKTWARSRPAAVYQLANEANLDSEHFGGGPADYAAWVGRVRALLPAGITVGVGAFSPGDDIPGVRPYSDTDGWDALAPMLDADPALVAVLHVYAPTLQGLIDSYRRQAALLPTHTHTVVGETNFGPGSAVHVDRTGWAYAALQPFLDWLATNEPRCDAVLYFAHRWLTPEPWFAGGTPVDGAGTRIETVLREWRASVVPVTPLPAPGPVPAPVVPPAPTKPPLASATDELKALARTIAAQHRLDWPITDRQVTAESNWNPRAVSNSGAKGLMQLMDPTARDLGVTDSFDPRQNLDGGMRYMRFLLTKYGGSYAKALAAYNWGPGNLDRLLATNPTGWRAGISAQAMRYLEKIKPPEDTMAAGNDGPRTRTIGAVVHSTRSGVERSLEDEAEKTAAWMLQGAPNPSCHKVISPTRSIEVVPKPLAAWHARDPLNGTHLGYELAQPFPTTPYHPGQYKLLARELVEDARAYGFPLVHITSGNTTPGIIGHEETANGRADGKSDPGALFDWALLLREITALVKKPFTIGAERDTLWGIKDNLAANGWPRLAQAVEAAVTQSKGER